MEALLFDNKVHLKTSRHISLSLFHEDATVRKQERPFTPTVRLREEDVAHYPFLVRTYWRDDLANMNECADSIRSVPNKEWPCRALPAEQKIVCLPLLDVRGDHIQVERVRYIELHRVLRLGSANS